LVPPDDAVRVTVVFELTVDVVAENVALVCPPATVINGGTFTLGSLLKRVTTSPPEGAALARFTVPVAVSPPLTVDGVIERLLTEVVLTCVPMA